MKRSEYSYLLNQTCKCRYAGGYLFSSYNNPIFMSHRSINHSREGRPSIESGRAGRTIRRLEDNVRRPILLTDAEKRPHIWRQSATHNRPSCNPGILFIAILHSSTRAFVQAHNLISWNINCICFFSTHFQPQTHSEEWGERRDNWRV